MSTNLKVFSKVLSVIILRARLENERKRCLIGLALSAGVIFLPPNKSSLVALHQLACYFYPQQNLNERRKGVSSISLTKVPLDDRGGRSLREILRESLVHLTPG